VEDGPVLAEILRRLGQRPRLGATPLLLEKLDAPDAEVRAAAVEALAGVQAVEARDLVRRFLEDRDPRVRRATAAAAGQWADVAATESLLRLARDPDPGVRRAGLDTLCRFREPRALSLAVAALANDQTELTALACVGELGGPDQRIAIAELAKRHPSAEVLSQVVRILNSWGSRQGASSARRQDVDRGIAEVQGSQGVLLRWQVRGPVSAQEAFAIVDKATPAGRSWYEADALPAGWRTLLATGTESPLKLGKTTGMDAASSWFGDTDLILSEPAKVQFLAGSSGTLRVWINGRPAFQRDQALPFRLDSDQFTVPLVRGHNRLLVQVAFPKGEAEFHLRFRRLNASAEHEKLTQAALTRRGDPDLGRKLFFNAEKTQCIKCHRLGDQGERIGPELTGAGSRFTRIYLIESILEPSRTIAPSFQTQAVALKNGQVLTGISVAETEIQLTLADNQGQKHVLTKGDIDERRAHPLSTMPEGLEKRLTTDEFVDLIAFLASQKETHGR
jgi:putative heme-binding domain-containing protein